METVRNNNHKSARALRGFLNELLMIPRRARQVWHLVPTRHKLALGGAAVIMVLTSAANTAIWPVLGTLLQQLIHGTKEGLGPNALYRIALFYLGILGGIYLGREVLNVIRRYLVENTCTRIDRDMTVRLVAHLLKVDLASFTHEKIGALNGRISRSVEGFVRLLRLSFLDFIPVILTGVFALVMSLQKQPWLGLIMAGVIPVSVALTLWQLISQKNIRLKLLRSREEMDGTVVEQLGGLDYVRAANTYRQETKRVAKAAEKRRAKELRHHFQMSLFGCAKALNEGLFHIFVLGFAIFLATRGTIDLGDILMFSGLFLNVMAPLSEVHRIIDEGHECSLRVGDLLELLAEPVDCSFETDPGAQPRLEGDDPFVVVEDLTVEYRTADGKRQRALDGLSLSIRRGETVGIAGPSGCGKSTWLKVLLRLTHPNSGRVVVGGVPLEEVSRQTIGDLIGYVGQNPFVFAGTIEENIAYGVENATPEAIRRAAELAHIHEEIMAMPGGYQAAVAERGMNLSGGQRQRLAIARLFLKNPPVLILDEATSALDTISERSVQRAIAAARENRTVILVAHRLSTLLDADRIFVIADGKVAESGTYAELVHRGGLFTELLRSAHEGAAEQGLLPALGLFPEVDGVVAPPRPGRHTANGHGRNGRAEEAAAAAAAQAV